MQAAGCFANGHYVRRFSTVIIVEQQTVTGLFQLRDNSELHRVLAALRPLRLLLDVNACPIPGLYLASRVGRSVLGDAGRQVVLNDGAVVEIQHGRFLR